MIRVMKQRDSTVTPDYFTQRVMSSNVGDAEMKRTVREIEKVGSSSGQKLKVLHIHLIGPYSEGFSYQENLLTKYHSKFGYDVTIIVSDISWSKRGQLERLPSSEYVNQDGVRVIRLSPRSCGIWSSGKFSKYPELGAKIEKLNPDVIFVHGPQFRDAATVERYCNKFPKVRLYVDNHADLYNSGRSLISKYLLHRIWWRYFAKKLERSAIRLWGVTQSCSDFLVSEYGVSPSKTGVLPLGADTDDLDFSLRNEIRQNQRELYKIDEDDLLLVTGGKIDRNKEIDKIVAALEIIEEPKIKLLIFGAVAEESKQLLSKISDSIRFIGWLEPEELHELAFAADLAVFPGSQSVIWNQLVAYGLPGIFRYWPGGSSVDLGGNAIVVDSSDPIVLSEIIQGLFTDRDMLENMRGKALNLGPAYFSYDRISRIAIADE